MTQQGFIPTSTTTKDFGFDYNKLCNEAQKRWLKPVEVLYILQNHEKFLISQKPPDKPPSGSLFLFNRRVLRYFRKDGHSWRKKQDGKNTGEAHERLKVGNADALSCYYARGDENPLFQRRSYWMLDPAYEHIVLVHYLQVSEGRFLPVSSSTSNLITGANNFHHQGITSGSSELYEPNGCSFGPGSLEEVISKFNVGKSDTDHLHIVDGLRNSDHLRHPEVSEAQGTLTIESSLDPDGNNTNHWENFPNSQYLGFLDYKTREPLLKSHDNTFSGLECSGDAGTQGSQSLSSDNDNIETAPSPSWNDILHFASSSPLISTRGSTSNLFVQTEVSDLSFSKFSEYGAHLPSRSVLNNDLLTSSEREGIPATSFNHPEKYSSLQLDQRENSVENKSLALCSSQSEIDPIQNMSGNRFHEPSSDMTILREENGTDWVGNIDLDISENPYSSDFSILTDQGQFSFPLGDDPSLTVADKQRFHIHEISPEWAFSFERTKVIIIGEFLCDSSECFWAIMFGDIQVPAKIIQEGVLQCMVPQHGEGKVTVCVTSGNRESCSEVRDFEFRAKPIISGSVCTSSKKDGFTNLDEVLLLVKLVNIFLYSSDELPNDSEVPSGTLDWILQELLKDKLRHYLASKYQGGDFVMSKQEQGIIHMISGLGYEWALYPILDSGVGVNFRDANGWTALHWAARFGREKMVAALLAAGASAGAVTDPTPLDPVGETPGAIASANHHSGLAGYLSEAALVSHLSSLTMEENEIFKGPAELEAERVVESISTRSAQMHKGGTEDELSLKDYLAAVRNAAQAAARIQAAFRAHSFKKRQEMAAKIQEDYGLNIYELSALSSKFQAYDKAALSIQKKYRGWKGRKDFLTLRKHVVRLQAHIRGHQERKKYKLFIQYVSVLEKAILRWRRKGVGLRGYRVEPEVIDEDGEEIEIEDIIKVFRKQKVDAAIDQAMSRVLSMVDSPSARQQYRRMLERFRQAKVDSGISDESTSKIDDDIDILESAIMHSYKRG